MAGSLLTITAQGVENGLRGANDGVTYFGCKKRSGKAGLRARNTEILNDVVIKTKDKELAQRHRGRHFKIEYSFQSSSYHIQDLAIGFGTYVRLSEPLVLKNDYLISMGESFIIVNLLPEAIHGKPVAVNESASQHGTNMRLRLKVFSGPTNGEM